MKLRTFLTLVFLVLFCTCTRRPVEIHLFPEIEELTIAEIHEAYRKGSLNSQDLVKAYLAAIENSDKKINAITFINPHALSRAQALDAEFQETRQLRSLHGIPLIVKDNINTAGLPTTAGARALQDYIPEKNAFIIEKLEHAGAIVLAKSNMAEWAFSPMHTESTTQGTTRNPYNLNYVPAGSSGGTAAAVAANFAAGGLGTDTGNSIRGPSAHTALVGIRPTLGLISREGIVPLFLRNDVVGPMCRTVEDATRVLEVMVGVDPKDPITHYSEIRAAKNYRQFLVQNGLEGSRIGVLRELSEAGADNYIKNLFEKAMADLDELGATLVDPAVIPDFTALRQNQWCSEFRTDVETFLTDYVKRDSIRTLEDLIRIGTTSSFAERKLEERAGFSGRWGDPGSECLDAYQDERRIAFRESIERMMDSLDLDALIYPTWNNKPARISRYEEEYKGDNSQIIAPHTGQPALTVPMGYSEDGLPAGLQFLGRMYDESTLIRLAYSYEQGTKHRKSPEFK